MTSRQTRRNKLACLSQSPGATADVVTSQTAVLQVRNIPQHSTANQSPLHGSAGQCTVQSILADNNRAPVQHSGWLRATFYCRRR